MEWKTATEFKKTTNQQGGDAHSYLIHHDGAILAWVYESQSKWYWEQFDNVPARGPFDSVAAAQLAADIHCNNPAIS